MTNTVSMGEATSNIRVSTDTLTPEEVAIVAADPNCQRSFNGNTLEEIWRPTSYWHRIEKYGVFAGAFLCEPNELDPRQVSTHICALQNVLTREEAITATQFSVRISQVQGLYPYTTVAWGPELNYMRKFLNDCGFVHYKSAYGHVDVYYQPR